MAFREGEVYRCPDTACDCAMTVTKGAPPAWAPTTPPVAAARR